jgi:hypothetical protein
MTSTPEHVAELYANAAIAMKAPEMGRLTQAIQGPKNIISFLKSGFNRTKEEKHFLPILISASEEKPRHPHP